MPDTSPGAVQGARHFAGTLHLPAWHLPAGEVSGTLTDPHESWTCDAVTDGDESAKILAKVLES